ncbi:MAG: hypothetical protein AAF423_11130 [Pseudomonadota bacterium]
MKAVGILFLLMGIGIGAIWPWAQLNFLGRETDRIEFGQPLSDPPLSSSTVLTKSDNPVRIRFSASYKVGGKLPPIKVPVKILVTDRDGALLSGIISFPTRGAETGPEQEKVRASKSIEFDVINEGEHKIHISLAKNKNSGGILVPDIASVTAIVVANAPELREDYKALAAVLVLAGIYILLRSRRRNKSNRLEPPDRWGRG